MKYQTYTKYKPSEIEWIDKLPDDWMRVKVKHLTFNLDGKRIPISAGEREGGEFPYYGATGVLDHVSSYIFNEDLLLVGEDGAPFFDEKKNVAFLISGKTWVNNHAHVLRVNKNANRTWLCYFLNVNDYRLYIKGSTRDKLNQDDLSCIRVAQPSTDAQNKIADFLDRKTSQIDGLIKKDKRLIELLRERRIALINQAVTKGLDPNAKLVDSGVGWIGEIPEGWEVRKLRQCFNLIGSGTTPDSQNEKYYIDGDTPWLITGDLNDGILDDTSKKITKEAVRSFSALKIFPKNSLVIAMYGATIGKVALTTFKTTTNQACCVLNNSDSFDMKFVYYWFIANKNEIISLSYGGGQPNISQDVIKNIKIQVPPLDIQKEIILYLDTKLEQMSKHASVVSERIGFLEEYKKSLIYNAVTGKIKV